MSENCFNRLKESMLKRVKDKQLASFVYGISVDGKEVEKYCFEDNERTIYRLASMTKPITSAIALIAEEKGLFSINDKITKYLPNFNKMKIGQIKNGKVEFLKYAQKDIRIIDILTHSSGFGSGSCGDIQVTNRKTPSSLKEAIKDYQNWYLDFEPFSTQLYSAVCALDIVAYIIEITSGMPYFDFLKKELLIPLEMADTTYKLNDEQLNRLAMMYYKNDDNIVEKRPFSSNTGFDGFKEGYPGGAAGLFSTYHDYMNFSNMLSCKGLFNGKRILSEQAVEKMGTGQLPLSFEGIDEFYNWGLAVSVRGKQDEDHPLEKGCFGWSGAYSSHFFVNTQKKYCAVFMCNVNNDLGAGSPNIAVFEKEFAKCMKDYLES